MGILCLEYKAISVPYFLDSMQMYELSPLLSNLHLTTKQRWEMTRQSMMASLSPYLKRGKKITDIIKFPWDDEKGGKKPSRPREITQEFKDELIRRAQIINNSITDNSNGE